MHILALYTPSMHKSPYYHRFYRLTRYSAPASRRGVKLHCTTSKLVWLTVCLSVCAPHPRVHLSHSLLDVTRVCDVSITLTVTTMYPVRSEQGTVGIANHSLPTKLKTWGGQLQPRWAKDPACQIWQPITLLWLLQKGDTTLCGRHRCPYECANTTCIPMCSAMNVRGKWTGSLFILCF